MAKVKKTYRLNDYTVERIQILKEFYEKQGVGLSDAQVIDKAIGFMMDIPFGLRGRKGLNDND